MPDRPLDTCSAFDPWYLTWYQSAINRNKQALLQYSLTISGTSVALFPIGIVPYICIFASLTTDLRVLSVMCHIMSSNRFCVCD